MKLIAARENKLKQVMTVLKNGMESIGLKWNEKKCNTCKEGQVEQDGGDMKIANLKPIKSLDKDSTYKFLGGSENIKQEHKQELDVTTKRYLQRLSVILSIPLSDHSKVVKPVCLTGTYILDVDTNVYFLLSPRAFDF